LYATGQERSSDSIAWIFKKRTLHRSETSDSYAQPEKAEQNDERSQIKAATAAGRRIAVSDFCRRERFPGHPQNLAGIASLLTRNRDAQRVPLRILPLGFRMLVEDSSRLLNQLANSADCCPRAFRLHRAKTMHGLEGAWHPERSPKPSRDSQ